MKKATAISQLVVCIVGGHVALETCSECNEKREHSIIVYTVDGTAV